VVSLVISETAGSLRVVPSHSQINNVVKRAIDQFLAPKIKPQEAPVSTKKYITELHYFILFYFINKHS
jgi:hypothetical protein